METSRVLQATLAFAATLTLAACATTAGAGNGGSASTTAAEPSGTAASARIGEGRVTREQFASATGQVRQAQLDVDCEFNVFDTTDPAKPKLIGWARGFSGEEHWVFDEKPFVPRKSWKAEKSSPCKPTTLDAFLTTYYSGELKKTRTYIYMMGGPM